MNKNDGHPLDGILIYFCTLPELKPVDTTSDFFTLKTSIIDHFKLNHCIINKLDSLKKKGETQKDSNTEKNVIIIAFTKMGALYDGQTYLKLTMHPTRLFQHCNESQNDLHDYHPYPIVVVGLEDISIISKNTKYNSSNQYLKHLNLDPRVKFFDSSIWHRYIALGDNFFNNFQNVLDELIENYQNELYDTVVSCEYMEFQTRMLRNSFLALIGSEGHGRNVTPFKYHSETLMKKKAHAEFEKIKMDTSQICWEFLLVDDYGDVQLRAKHGRNIQKTKKEIIDSLVNMKNQQKIIEITNAVEVTNSQEEIHSLDTKRGRKDVIQSAEKKIKEKMYDIILLDYLLGENTIEKRREYGHELLEKIFDAESGDPILKFKGPMDYFWIFPISVFAYAILDELFEKGMGHFGKYWHLASGADPINTPHLFRYKLFRFMNLQLRKAGLRHEFNAFTENPPTSTVNPKIWASSVLGKLLSEFGNRKKLIEDAQLGNSSFAKSIINSDAEIHYYEHLQHLIYLLAHGSGLEWPEMWHELEYLKSNLVMSKKLPEKFFNYIEKYISQLQGKYS